MRTSALIATLLLVAGCTGGRPLYEPSLAPSPVSTACPVTLPTRAEPPGPTAEELFGAESSYGNGKLWVGGLGSGGIITPDDEMVEPDGSVGWKFGWWRGVPGKLTITGRRLDGAAPPVRGSVPNGYGDGGFQASGVYFPTDGCWEVTGAVGSTSLTFVTLVRLP